MKKYIVIGNPIEHSLSPKLHNHWIKKNKINAICLSKDDKLNINLKKNFNEEKIKQILFDSFKIRKTEILVSKIQEKNIITGFKSI